MVAGSPLKVERDSMLVLNRKSQEELLIDDDIRIVVLDVIGNRVRLGITAPSNVQVNREEIVRRLCVHSDNSMGLQFNQS